MAQSPPGKSQVHMRKLVHDMDFLDDEQVFRSKRKTELLYDYPEDFDPQDFEMSGSLPVESKEPSGARILSRSSTNTSTDAIMLDALVSTEPAHSADVAMLDAPNALEATTPTTSFFTSIINTVTNIIPQAKQHISSLLSLPSRYYTHYSGQQVTRVEYIVRPDGAKKRRLLDASARNSRMPCAWVEEPETFRRISRPPTSGSNPWSASGVAKPAVTGSPKQQRKRPVDDLDDELTLYIASHTPAYSPGSLLNLSSARKKWKSRRIPRRIRSSRVQSSPYTDIFIKAGMMSPTKDATIQGSDQFIESLLAPTASSEEDIEKSKQQKVDDAEPRPRARKKVSWSTQNHVKEYDENTGLDKMMDSFVAAMKVSPLEDLSNLSYAKMKDSSNDGSFKELRKVNETILKELNINDPLVEEFEDLFLQLEPSLDGKHSLRGPDEPGKAASELAAIKLKTEQEKNEEQIAKKEEEAVDEKKKIPQSQALPKPLVTPISDEWATKIQNLAETTNFGILRGHKVGPRLTTEDFGTLLSELFGGQPGSGPRGWLNDNIVNEYLDILVNYLKDKAGYIKKARKAPSVHNFPSMWWVNVSQPGGETKVKAWARRQNLGHTKLLDADLVLFPCNSGLHWTLLAIKPKERTIEYLDSLWSHGKSGDFYLDRARAWLEQELEKEYNESEWCTIIHRSVRQLNGSDCGIFTILNALALLRGEEPSLVESSDGMEQARLRIAVTLMNGKATSEFD